VGAPPYSRLRVDLDSRVSSADRITVNIQGNNRPFNLSLIEDIDAVVKILKDRLVERMLEVGVASDRVALLGYMIFPLWGVTNAGTKWLRLYTQYYPPGYPGDRVFHWFLERHVRGVLQAEARDLLDTRMGRFFPSKAYSGGINLDPGTYTISINYYSGNTLLHTDRRENVEVQAGRLNLIQSVCFKGTNLPEYEVSYHRPTEDAIRAREMKEIEEGGIVDWARGTYFSPFIKDDIIVGHNIIWTPKLRGSKGLWLLNVRTEVQPPLEAYPNMRWAYVYYNEQKVGIILDRDSVNSERSGIVLAIGRYSSAQVFDYIVSGQSFNDVASGLYGRSFSAVKQ
jgi:hypothetical protein